MTTTPVTSVTATLEPAKRIIRTVIALVIAIATVLPYFIGHTHFSSETITGILTQLGAVAAGITAFGASKIGNYFYGLIGLDATAVAKLTTDIKDVGDDVEPAVEAVVTAVEHPSVDSSLAAGGTVVEAIPAVSTDGSDVAADVQAVMDPPNPAA